MRPERGVQDCSLMLESTHSDLGQTTSALNSDFPTDVPGQSLVRDLALLVREARTPTLSAKGRVEGAHCPDPANRGGRGPHRCVAESAECVEAGEFCRQATRLWHMGVPVCIDVMMVPPPDLDPDISGWQDVDTTFDFGDVTKRPIGRRGAGLDSGYCDTGWDRGDSAYESYKFNNIFRTFETEAFNKRDRTYETVVIDKDDHTGCHSKPTTQPYDMSGKRQTQGKGQKYDMKNSARFKEAKLTLKGCAEFKTDTGESYRPCLETKPSSSYKSEERGRRERNPPRFEERPFRNDKDTKDSIKVCISSSSSSKLSSLSGEYDRSRDNTTTGKSASHMKPKSSMTIEEKMTICASSTETPTSSVAVAAEDGLLLERWTLEARSRGHETGVSASMLVQAVRSHLHFSQISSWLYSTAGHLPATLTYRVNPPMEEASPELCGLTDVHQFPACPTSPSSRLLVSVASLPRQQTIPCWLGRHGCVPATQKLTTSKQHASFKVRTSAHKDQSYPNFCREHAVPVARKLRAVDSQGLDDEASNGSARSETEDVISLTAWSRALSLTSDQDETRSSQGHEPRQKGHLGLFDCGNNRHIDRDNKVNTRHAEVNFAAHIRRTKTDSCTSTGQIETDLSCHIRQTQPEPSASLGARSKYKDVIRPEITSAPTGAGLLDESLSSLAESKATADADNISLEFGSEDGEVSLASSLGSLSTLSSFDDFLSGNAADNGSEVEVGGSGLLGQLSEKWAGPHSQTPTYPLGLSEENDVLLLESLNGAVLEKNCAKEATVGTALSFVEEFQNGQNLKEDVSVSGPGEGGAEEAKATAQFAMWLQGDGLARTELLVDQKDNTGGDNQTTRKPRARVRKKDGEKDMRIEQQKILGVSEWEIGESIDGQMDTQIKQQRLEVREATARTVCTATQGELLFTEPHSLKGNKVCATDGSATQCHASPSPAVPVRGEPGEMPQRAGAAVVLVKSSSDEPAAAFQPSRHHQKQKKTRQHLTTKQKKQLQRQKKQLKLHGLKPDEVLREKEGKHTSGKLSSGFQRVAHAVFAVAETITGRGRSAMPGQNGHTDVTSEGIKIMDREKSGKERRCIGDMVKTNNDQSNGYSSSSLSRPSTEGTMDNVQVQLSNNGAGVSAPQQVKPGKGESSDIQDPSCPSYRLAVNLSPDLPKPNVSLPLSVTCPKFHHIAHVTSIHDNAASLSSSSSSSSNTTTPSASPRLTNPISSSGSKSSHLPSSLKRQRCSSQLPSVGAGLGELQGVTADAQATHSDDPALPKKSFYCETRSCVAEEESNRVIHASVREPASRLRFMEHPLPIPPRNFNLRGSEEQVSHHTGSTLSHQKPFDAEPTMCRPSHPKFFAPSDEVDISTQDAVITSSSDSSQLFRSTESGWAPAYGSPSLSSNIPYLPFTEDQTPPSCWYTDTVPAPVLHSPKVLFSSNLPSPDWSATDVVKADLTEKTLLSWPCDYSQEVTTPRQGQSREVQGTVGAAADSKVEQQYGARRQLDYELDGGAAASVCTALNTPGLSSSSSTSSSLSSPTAVSVLARSSRPKHSQMSSSSSWSSLLSSLISTSTSSSTTPEASSLTPITTTNTGLSSLPVALSSSSLSSSAAHISSSPLATTASPSPFTSTESRTTSSNNSVPSPSPQLKKAIHEIRSVAQVRGVSFGSTLHTNKGSSSNNNSSVGSENKNNTTTSIPTSLSIPPSQEVTTSCPGNQGQPLRSDPTSSNGVKLSSLDDSVGHGDDIPGKRSGRGHAHQKLVSNDGEVMEVEDDSVTLTQNMTLTLGSNFRKEEKKSLGEKQKKQQEHKDGRRETNMPRPRSLPSLRPHGTIPRFNNRTGLPLQSSPASVRRSMPSAPPPKAVQRLLGSFEESLLNGRIMPAGAVDGFTCELGASGAFCPAHLRLPVVALFFPSLSEDDAPSPYLGHISLGLAGKKGYHIPRRGAVQVTLFNPNQTVVKMFVVHYDLSDMPASSRTFLRQKTVYRPTTPGGGPSYLRYLIHLRFATSQSGKLYLHTDIRLIFARHKLELDNTANHLQYELKSFTEAPRNPKYSPKK